MKPNMGALDRILRLLLSAIVLVLYFSHQITGTAAIVLGIIAAIFLITGIIGFCPLYAIFKISTRKKKS